MLPAGGENTPFSTPPPHTHTHFKEPKGRDADGIKRNAVRARGTGKRLDLAERLWLCVNSLDVSLQPHTDNTFPSHREGGSWETSLR